MAYLLYSLEIGTVPIYLGDHEHLRALLPHHRSAIFVHDFQGNISKLVGFLNDLATNETAYEEYRIWRPSFKTNEHLMSKTMLQKSLQCRICEWAVGEFLVTQSNTSSHLACQEEPSDRRVVRGPSKELFLMQNGTLNHIPDIETFLAMDFKFDKILPLSENEGRKYKRGPPVSSVTNQSIAVE